MNPITIVDLTHYMACCRSFEIRPTLGGWIAAETEGQPAALAREYDAQCRAVWPISRPANAINKTKEHTMKLIYDIDSEILLSVSSARKLFQLRHDTRDGHEARQTCRYWISRVRTLRNTP